MIPMARKGDCLIYLEITDGIELFLRGLTAMTKIGYSIHAYLLNDGIIHCCTYFPLPLLKGHTHGVTVGPCCVLAFPVGEDQSFGQVRPWLASPCGVHESRITMRGPPLTDRSIDRWQIIKHIFSSILIDSFNNKKQNI